MNANVRLALVALAGGLGLAAGSRPAQAIIVGTGTAGSGLTSDWFGVGMVGRQNGNVEDYFCTGTLITNRHVLTAAHCVTENINGLPQPHVVPFGPNSMRFTVQSPGIGTATYQSIAVIPHPDYDGDEDHGNDIALIRLDQPVTAAQVWPINNGYVDETDTNLVAHQVGFGVGGDGFAGETPQLFPSGSKREGINRIDLVNGGPNVISLLTGMVGSNLLTFNVAPRTLTFDFDNPNSATPNILGGPAVGTNEATITHVDSGGPTFLYSFSLENWVIVGVHSYGCIPFNPLNPDHPILGAHCIPSMTEFGQFGQLAVDTQVSAYADWIGQVVAATPEPGTLVMVALGALFTLRRRR